MSMWDYDKQGDPYPPNERREYRDPYASHSGSSDYHGGYGGHQSHNDHTHHHHGHNQHHGYDHTEDDDAHSHHSQRSEGTNPNYRLRHESYRDHGDHQSYGQNAIRHDLHGSHGHDSYVTPTYASNMARAPTTQLTHHGGSHHKYNMNFAYETWQEHHAPPPSTEHGHEASSRTDLFTSESVVNLTLNEIDALARTHRSRSWLVVLYAPWCYFCQAMEPNFERVAHHLERSNVYVGRFRADGDYKEYAKHYLQFEHFPTILFFPKDSSHIVKYQSENREVDALLGFVHAF